jgi:hypothetical protein
MCSCGNGRDYTLQAGLVNLNLNIVAARQNCSLAQTGFVEYYAAGQAIKSWQASGC